MTQPKSAARILLLDGGMGSTLESEGHDVSNPLWGCNLLHSDPSAISSVHEGFIDAGAGLIETATYQLTLDELKTHAGIDESTAGDTMRRGLEIASTAASNSLGNVEVVLSIGPYGAILYPAQEYTGIYPPPYGLQSSQDVPPSNSFLDPNDEYAAEFALVTFHLDRIRIFSSDQELWSRIRYIAFETIPLITEIRAARKVMGQLRVEGKDKPFWITSAFPHGQHPQVTHNGQKATVEDILRAALGSKSEPPLEGNGHEGLGPPADGVGFNCTNPKYISSLSDQFTTGLIALQQQGVVDRDNPTMFVMYPDGGMVWDPVTRKWSSGKPRPTSWAKQVMTIVRSVERATTTDSGRKVWEKVIVGGCCNAGYEEIAALRRQLVSSEGKADNACSSSYDNA